MKAYKSHPLADLFPMMPDEEIDRLAESIKENGLREPIILHQGKILDGRNRYQACKRIKMEARFDEYEGKNPLAFVLDSNLHRRHLNTSQRSVIAARLGNLAKGVNKKDTSIDVSQKDAARLLNVGVASVQRAKSLLEKAPELARQVDAGEKSLNKAANEASAENPEKEPEWDATVAAGHLHDWLYKKLNEWPERDRATAGHMIRQMLEKEFHI